MWRLRRLPGVRGMRTGLVGCRATAATTVLLFTSAPSTAATTPGQAAATAVTTAAQRRRYAYRYALRKTAAAGCRRGCRAASAPRGTGYAIDRSFTAALGSQDDDARDNSGLIDHSLKSGSQDRARRQERRARSNWLHSWLLTIALLV
jgi:hypothetical protein